jgi:predicted nuclease of predicted toxin-antitoxin system
MTRFYADENFHFGITQELRRLGYDVLTVQQAGKAGQRIPDQDVLAYAISLGRAVLTHDRPDYIRLHRQTPQHAGIVICTNDPDFRAAAQRIHQAVIAESPLDNKLVRVNRPAVP